MDINWLIDNEKYLNAIVQDYKDKETELFNQFKAAIVKEKSVRTSTDLCCYALDNKCSYYGKDWMVGHDKARFNNKKILSKDYIKELYELARSIRSNQSK